MSDIVVVLVEVVLSLQEFKLGLDTGYIVARSHFKLAGIQEDTKLAFESTSDIANYTYVCFPHLTHPMSGTSKVGRYGVDR